MGDYVTLEVDAARRVGTIRLDRPKMNALSRQVWRELAEAAREARDRDDVGAVVVWGGPNVFAAGADVKEFPGLDVRTARDELGPLLRDSLAAVEQLPQVTIAAVHGYALGGGCELAMACDFRYAADDATLGQPEILLGLIPGAGGTQRLPRLIGLSRAKDLIYSGRTVSAQQAERWGLVDRVYPAAELYDAAVAAAAGFAAGPYALRLAKQAISDGVEMALEEGVRLESSLFAQCFATEDARIGVRSFIEQGPGKGEFTGR
ncbi:MAG: enoyl-CoA hydratase/isomerase family protein [Actinomycetota bacterium]|nr:enoyl-CoA hydratase/isomerase family protein [Actinomycetota bacterium]